MKNRSNTHVRNPSIGNWLKLSHKIYKMHISLKNGFWFFFRANIILVVMIALFAVNKSEWRSVGEDKVMVFIFTFECLIILFSTFACINPKQGHKQHRVKEWISKNEWIGMVIAILKKLLYLEMEGLQVLRSSGFERTSAHFK